MGMSRRFWSSGTNEGYGCDVKHGWCGSNTFFAPNMPWKTGEPNNHLKERCIDLHMNTSQVFFSDIFCGSLRNFICEVEISFKMFYEMKLNFHIFPG